MSDPTETQDQPQSPKKPFKGHKLTAEDRKKGGRSGTRAGVPNGSTREIEHAKATFGAIGLDPLKELVDYYLENKKNMTFDQALKYQKTMMELTHSKAPVLTETKKTGGKFDHMSDEEVYKQLEKEYGDDELPPNLVKQLKLVKK